MFCTLCKRTTKSNKPRRIKVSIIHSQNFVGDYDKKRYDYYTPANNTLVILITAVEIQASMGVNKMKDYHVSLKVDMIGLYLVRTRIVPGYDR